MPPVSELLRVAAAALAGAAEALQVAIDGALPLLQDRRHLVLTGIGKSGLIARKAAGTFASLGQPAIFLHPVEAQHGDLGVLAPGDGVLALSWSGESAELLPLLRYAGLLGLPRLAITAGRTSPLAQHTDALLLPPVAEAAPFGAPVVRSLLLLAAVDALAVALSQTRGFGREAFSRRHPAGALGQSS